MSLESRNIPYKPIKVDRSEIIEVIDNGKCLHKGGTQGTGPCPEEQQGAAYIRTLTCPRYLPGVMASLACSFRNSAMSCETDCVSIAISLCASGAVYGFISL